MWRTWWERRVFASVGVGCLAAALAGCGQGSSTAPGVVVSDPTGDGLADIVEMAVSTERSSPVRVRVRVERVTGDFRIVHFLELYVDPTGKSERPSFSRLVVLNSPQPNFNSRTRGWKSEGLDRRHCGDTISLHNDGPTAREVVFEFPRECLSRVGVRFAAKTSREDTRRATSDTMRMGNPDWVPARRTLAESLRF